MEINHALDNRPYSSEIMRAMEKDKEIFNPMDVECQFLVLLPRDYPFIETHIYIRPDFEVNHWDHPDNHPLLNQVVDQSPFYFSSPV